MFYLDVYQDRSIMVELGELRDSNNVMLTDMGALAILDDRFYAINNSGTPSTSNRLYRIYPTEVGYERGDPSRIGRPAPL